MARLVAGRHAQKGRCNRCIFFDALRVKIRVDAVAGKKGDLPGPGVLPNGARARVNPELRALLDKEIAFGQSR